MSVGKAAGAVLVLGVCFLSPDLARAFNWTATGSFKYQDREFDQNGFTGATPSLPVRFAKVEVRFRQGGGTQLLATGATDGNGNYSVPVLNDTSTRDIQIRVLTASGVSDLFLQVTNVNGSKNNYAITTGFFLSHMPNQNLNAGSFTGVIGSGGEAFNIYDVALNTIEYLKFLNGTRPDSSQELELQWESFGGVFVNSYIGSNTVMVADNSPYNDTVIQHESGHFAEYNFSASDSPGGAHHLTDCGQDLRLAFDEGFATYFGQSVRLHFGLSHPQLYVKTTGAPGPGNLDFYFDVEDEQPFTCSGAASEVTVYAALWDVVDTAATLDDTPGLEEAWDSMGSAELLVWDVMRNYIPSALNKSIEDFWDGWFIRGEGSLGSMVSMFVRHGMEFRNDASEPNDDILSALSVVPNGIPFHASYFRDQGNGAGAVDMDFFKFYGLGGSPYQISTTHLVGDANTSIQLIAADGFTVLQSNDDRSILDKSSLITFTVPTTGTYFIKSFHGPGNGMYGSYDIAVTGGSTQAGPSVLTPNLGFTVHRHPTTVDGGDAHPLSATETLNEERDWN